MTGAVDEARARAEVAMARVIDRLDSLARIASATHKREVLATIEGMKAKLLGTTFPSLRGDAERVFEAAAREGNGEHPSACDGWNGLAKCADEMRDFVDSMFDVLRDPSRPKGRN
jgi:hypothetical protein